MIERLLQSGPQVLATGGGAYMNAATRALVRDKGVSIWLKADLDTLMRRVRRRSDRPLLKTADPEATMRGLIDQRYPVYAEAELTIASVDGPHEQAVEAISGSTSCAGGSAMTTAATVPVALAGREYDILIGRGLTQMRRGNPQALPESFRLHRDG